MRSHWLAGFLSVCTLAAQPNPGAGSIQGHVRNLVTGAPVRKAFVQLTAAQVRLTADTDSEGKFQFWNLPPGTYRLSASRTGFLDRPVRRAVALGADDRVTNAEICLMPQGVITGRVLDESGEPVDRARVWISKQVYRQGRRSWEQINAVSETSDTGEYHFANLAPGRYMVRAYDQKPEASSRYGELPNTFSVLTYYPNAATQEQALPVEVGLGAEANGIEIRILKLARPATVHVRGKVAGAPSGSLVSVNLSPVDGGPFGGGNAMAAPPEYTFDLSATPGRYTAFANVYSGGPEAYATGSITVTGDAAGLVLAMSAAPEVAGHISVAEGGTTLKFQGVRISITRAGSNLTSELRADATGRFAFPKPLMPGRYQVVNVRGIPEGYFVREMKLGGQEISPDDFLISASAQFEMVLGKNAGEIAGSVSDAGGQPLAGSIVTLIPSDEKSRPEKQQVDDDGHFRFTALRPGKYKLLAWEDVDDDLWQDPEFRRRYEGRAEEISIDPGGKQKVQLRAIGMEEMK